MANKEIELMEQIIEKHYNLAERTGSELNARRVATDLYIKGFTKIDRIIEPCNFEGQGSCKSCNDAGKYNRIWGCFLYKIRGKDGCYCSDCVNDFLQME